MTTLIRDAVLDAWALLIPVDCAGCGVPDRSICSDCRRQLAPVITDHQLPDGTHAVSALDYQGVVRHAILALKEHGRTDVAGHLAAPLRVAMRAACAAFNDRSSNDRLNNDRSSNDRLNYDRSSNDRLNYDRSSNDRPLELLTIPTGRSSFRRRGYDPVPLLLRRAGLVAPARVLRRTRETTQQKVLDRESRSRNQIGSLASRHPLTGRQFVLVDDVMTTGATLVEAVRAVRQAGGDVVSAVTLAHTEKLFAKSATL